jgi:hypothetical protein
LFHLLTFAFLINSRGRTTTGMIVASLLSMILSNDALGDMTDSFMADSGSISSASNTNSFNSFYSSGRGSLDDDNEDESREERERYQNGEYRVILQVVSVLTYGKLAKRLTDQAINMCDHMQNLRKAIYDYKLRTEAIPDPHSKKFKGAREVALNYLVRYFYLIVFANYLLETGTAPTANTNSMIVIGDESEDENFVQGNAARGPSHIVEEDETSSTAFKEARKLTTFKAWLKGRREIINIISLQSLDLS